MMQNFGWLSKPSWKFICLPRSISRDQLLRNEKRLGSSKNLRYLFAVGDLDGGLRRVADPIWSLRVFNIEKTLVNEIQPVIYYSKDRLKHGFVKIVPRPETSCLLKEFARWNIKKKNVKNESLNNPSSPGESIQETKNDMNNKKIKKSCQSDWEWRRSKQSIYTLFCQLWMNFYARNPKNLFTKMLCSFSLARETVSLDLVSLYDTNDA